MLKFMKKTAARIFAAALILNTAVLPMTGYTAPIQAKASTIATVNAKKLHIRSAKKTSAKCIRQLRKGRNVEVLTTGTKWVKVSIDGQVGYTEGKYLSTEYGNASCLDANVIKGTVRSEKLKIYSNKNDSSMVLATVEEGTKVKVLTPDKRWVKVDVHGITGYAKGNQIATANGGTASNTLTKGESVVDFALQFVGNPYRWGGTSLTGGADCSGYIMSIYRHFGKSLPHSSRSMRGCGTRVSSLKKAQPGDIICYSGHVALYMGNNKIVHASNPRDGIKISSNASYRPIVAIRRIFN